MTSQPQYGTAFAAWRAGAEPAWGTYAHHRFVAGLCDGTLPPAAFLHYLKQDYIFLIHFSRAWALAVAKSETLDEMKAAAATVNALVNHEMQLHVETCAAAGISEEMLQATLEAPENLSYTRYVLEAGYSGDLLDLLAALAPCVLGYGEIGTRLGQDATDKTYAQWIETYSGDDYQSACRDVGALIDSALVRRLGENFQSTPRWSTLQDRFTTATRLEVGFWDMGLRPE